MNDEKYLGNDNFGKPKSEFIKKLKNLTDDELYESCKQYIWLSAYANNNPKSDYHWQCDACYDECKTRNKINIYDKVYKYNTRNL